MVLIDLEYFPKLARRQVAFFRGILLNSSIKRNFCSVNSAKCGAAKIYGLRLGFFKLEFIFEVHKHTFENGFEF